MIRIDQKKFEAAVPDARLRSYLGPVLEQQGARADTQESRQLVDHLLFTGVAFSIRTRSQPIYDSVPDSLERDVTCHDDDDGPNE